jgi:hypothetical protein
VNRSYREVLIDASRRHAFESLLRVRSSKQGMMSYITVLTVLDIMLLTGLIDHRKLLSYLINLIFLNLKSENTFPA